MTGAHHHVPHSQPVRPHVRATATPEPVKPELVNPEPVKPETAKPDGRVQGRRGKAAAA